MIFSCDVYVGEIWTATSVSQFSFKSDAAIPVPAGVGRDARKVADVGVCVAAAIGPAGNSPRLSGFTRYPPFLAALNLGSSTKESRMKNVMIIDDSKTIRRSAEIFLRNAGYQVTMAEDGFDALAKIASSPPDLIFVDILMPRLDGYQTCALIRKSRLYRETPIVMLSAKDSMFDRARARMVGADEHLTKPFTKENLLRATESHLCQRHAA
jgi:twitching motility two-component system response regulator PilG